MHDITRLYIDGAFVAPHGQERFDLFNPATEAVIGQVTLGDAEDARRAIAAAKRGLPGLSRSPKAERVAMLRRLHQAVLARVDDIRDATILEYGGPVSRAQWGAQYAAEAFLLAAQTLEDYPLERRIGRAEVVMESVG